MAHRAEKTALKNDGCKTGAGDRTGAPPHSPATPHSSNIRHGTSTEFTVLLRLSDLEMEKQTKSNKHETK